MIRNETEYARAVQRLEELRERLSRRKARLGRLGLSGEEIETSLRLLRTTMTEQRHKITTYERLREGDQGALVNFHGFGERLIALRIACGVTQQELAGRLGVHRSQVSRDERTDYHGITVERAARILDALGAHMKSFLAPPRARARVTATHGRVSAARSRSADSASSAARR